jgi:hypothetical protein
MDVFGGSKERRNVGRKERKCRKEGRMRMEGRKIGRKDGRK